MRKLVSPPTESNTWLLVAHNVLHLERTKAGAVTWWCVKRDAAVGDKCFLYRPAIGVVLYFEILNLEPSQQGFCNAYAMATIPIHRSDY